LDHHIINNFGTITLNKGPNLGLLLRNMAGIRNLPGATWIMPAGAIVESVGTPSFFENGGLLGKTTTDEARILVNRFINTGEVEVREGVLKFNGAEFDGVEQHFGSYRVDSGARLDLLSPRSSYRRSTRIYGQGNVDFFGNNTELQFPGSLEVGGTVRVLERAVHFSGTTTTTGPWQIVGEARISGLAPRIANTLTVQNPGIFPVDSASPLVVNALIRSNRLTVNTAL
jgi:hypothetical protein